MVIDKFGPPEVRGVDVDFDIYFRLNKPEASAVASPAIQAAIAAQLTAAGGPYGAAAAILVMNYLGEIEKNTGPNGCSVKLTIRNGLAGMQMKEFIAEPI
ncbi:hypothetical protein [Achromobacter kerstersii]|uniref:hypothetical protein n=1 Tax=Achromobacter kerstersii TaxID=1353890 RepID=UPI0006C41BC1|nr:hypothetical protein [Achromobacter kerstersii]CUJ49341.1 Uncharacterised protein [Achromobacter kerstersii]